MGLFDTIKKAFTEDNSKKARNQKSSGFTTRSDYAKQSKETYEKVKDAFTAKVQQGENPVVPSYAQTSRDSGVISSYDNKQSFKTLKNNLIINNTVEHKSSDTAYSGGQYSFIGGQVQDIIEANKPKTFVELAQNAAKTDTGEDRNLSELEGYTIDRKLHNNIIGWGEYVIQDEQAIDKWILSAPNDAEAERRLKEVKKFFGQAGREGNALHYVDVWDPESNSYIKQAQIRLDADFPPWLERNLTNQNWWDYYKTYSHDVVQFTANKYKTEKLIADDRSKYKYKSAFSNAEGTGDIDSYSDVLINALAGDGISDKFNRLIKGFTKYNTEYVVNPLRARNYKTAVGNAAWNMMETMDIAARGVRAFTAGDQNLGGTKGSFKGQKDYWVKLNNVPDKEAQFAQKIFINHGGEVLLRRANGDRTGFSDKRTDNEIKAELAKAFNEDPVLQKYGITWEDIYSAIDNQYFKQDASELLNSSLDNIKEAYTDIDASYSADTGSLASDIILESVLDPGLVSGGMSKNLTQGTVRTAAKEATSKGIRMLFSEADEAEKVLNNKAVRAAINNFISSNEGRNILFKNYDKFDNDVELLIRRIQAADSSVFETVSDRRVFKNTVVSELMGANTDINGKVIASTSWARRGLDDKTVKAAAYLDRAIDGIDSAIIKSSFPIPWLTFKAFRGSKKAIFNSSTVGNIIEKLKLKESEAVRTVYSDLTGAVDVTSFNDLITKADNSIIDERATRKSLQLIVDEYDNASMRVRSIINDFSEGKLSDEDALRAVSNEIQAITGGGSIKTIDDLEAFVSSLDMRYAKDVQLAFNDFSKTVDMLNNIINRRSSNVIDGFLDKVRQIKSEDDLGRLFREYMDNSYVMNLRTEVLNVLPERFKNLDIDRIVNYVLNGQFADIERKSSDVLSEIDTELKAIGEISEKTIERKLTLETFQQMLESINFDFKWALRDQAAIELGNKIEDFIKHWTTQDYVIYNTGDALKVLDRMERQVHMKYLLNPGVNAQEAALVTHKFTTEFRKLRKQIKKIDVVSLRDAKVVSLLHMDRMALHQQLRNDPAITKLYKDAYNDLFDSFIKEIDNMISEQAGFMESSFVQDMLFIKKQRNGKLITDNMITRARAVEGFTDDQLHVFLDLLASNFRTPGDLDELMLNPGSLRRKLEATIKAQTGESKLGMRNLTDALQSIDSEAPADFLVKYRDELSNPKVREDYDRIVNRDALDPKAYVEKQMLATALMDYSVIDTWNEMAKAGKSPMGFHINTTGLNSDLNSITSISFKKWEFMDISENNPFTLERLLDHLDSQKAIVFRRKMTDAEINGISEDVLRSFDIKDTTLTDLRKHYKSIYGKAGVRTYNSEQALLEDVCGFLNQNGQRINSEGVAEVAAPSLIIHDLDGFNIPFFNSKASSYRNVAKEDSKLNTYLNALSGPVKDNQFNTYARLSEKVGDIAYTDEQFSQITAILQDYITDINKYASGYRFMDMSSYSRKIENLYTTLSVKRGSKEGLTDIETRFYNNFKEKEGLKTVYRYNEALQDITKLTINPRQYAFVSTGLEDNPLKAAIKATGRTNVNIESRIYIDDIVSFFNLESDGFVVAVEDLRKMDEMAKYIIYKRNYDISSTASAFLAPHKEEFDQIIQAFIGMARHNSWDGTQLSYIQHMKVPDNAVDSYLMAQKLYNDYARFWLDDDELMSLSSEGLELDLIKSTIQSDLSIFDYGSAAYHKDVAYHKAIDYINNHRKRFFTERVGGRLDFDNSIAFDILEGAHRPEIYKSAAKSDYVKQVLSFEDGILKRGIDKAVQLSEANSEVVAHMTDLSHIDTFYNTHGIKKTTDRMLASLHMKTKVLFDTLNDTNIVHRESFQRFINKASEAYRLRLHNARYYALKTNGVFDRQKLLAELTHNGFNMTVFNAFNYDVSEIRDLRNFITDLQNKGDDFISYYEDRSTGNFFIYLNDQAVITESGTQRFIQFGNKIEGFERPLHDSVGLATFDELKELIKLEDIEDFREVYEQLLSCWEDTRMLSYGAINCTSGKAVSHRQAEEFLATLPSKMNDWCTSEGLLKSEISRGIVYDPGFVINEDSDVLLDYLSTMEHQVNVAKDDAILVNEVFASDDVLKFRELAESFSDDELIAFFSNNPDYVVCSLGTGKGTRTGLQIRQLKIDNRASLRAAKNLPNTTILPYDVFCEVADYMNATTNDSIYKRMLSKYLLAYKAFALVKPGTVIRNYVDATTKAALDTGEGVLSGGARMLYYEGRAISGMDTFHKIMKSDPALLTQSNWDIIQRAFNTDLTYEEFDVLRGVIDSNTRFSSADRYFCNKTIDRRGGRIISGKNIDLRNLDEKDINTAFEKYLKDELNLPLTKDEFKGIYLGDVVPDAIKQEQFDDMYRTLSNKLRHTQADTIFNGTINNMFKPFGAVENVVRYAQTLSLIDQGMSGNQVLKHIHNTQFYSAPSWGVWNTLEKVMPFVTFKYNNIMYWMRMIDENPRYFRYFEEIYGNIAEDTFENMTAQSQEISYENDYALQSGSIPIGGGKVYFKVGNSFLSAMDDYYGLPTDLDSLNPLLKDTLKYSLYAFGLNSSKYFSNYDLDITDEDPIQHAIQLIPGASLVQSGYKTFNNIINTSTEEGGPNMDSLVSTLGFLGILGKRYLYSHDAGFSFTDWQEDLSAQGLWYDCNLGAIVDISKKNELGANNPMNSFEDIQAYMFINHGKLWDANQYKFVTLDDYQAGGYNNGFDWDTDPEKAWSDLQAYMKSHGKVYDYNQRKFVFRKDYISGGLNSPTLSWEQKVQLMEEKFPNMKWDSNQNTFVDQFKYINGGLNDSLAFNEVMSLRLALYGETYDRAAHKFNKTTEPSIVLINNYTDREFTRKYAKYFSLLAIPKLQDSIANYTINDGLLMTKDGKYVLTGLPEYDGKVFNKFRYTFSYTGRKRSRHCSGWKNYSYNKTKKSNKPYGGDSSNYQTGYGWNEEEGYYRLEYSYRYQYHNPQPSSRFHRLISPPVHYPYGGGYGKFSFNWR